MDAIKLNRLAAPLLVLVLAPVGCGELEDSAGARGEIRTNPFLGDAGIADLQLSQELHLDLTGDGMPEQIVVSVDGADPRQLEIDLTVLGRDGATHYASSWSSADYPELQRADLSDAPGWVVSQSVRERLQDLLSDESVQPLFRDEVDPAVVARELRFEAWRVDRGLPATVPLTPDEEAEVAAVEITEGEILELVDTLVDRPALTYLAGDRLRTIVWSPEMGRLLAVYDCC